MMKERLQKVVDMIKIKDGDNNKKKIENLVVFVILLIITIIMINVILNGDTKDKKEEINTGKVLAKVDETNKKINYLEEDKTNDLESRLENILCKIDGVGSVDVLITYSESSKVIAMYNEDSTKNDTEEKDTNRRK